MNQEQRLAQLVEAAEIAAEILKKYLHNWNETTSLDAPLSGGINARETAGHNRTEVQ